MLDMSELMHDPDFIQPDAISVLRFTGSFDGHGLYSANPPEVDPKTMVIQHSPPATLLALAEGERNTDNINWWSEDEIILADGVSEQESDVILWRNRYYRVIRRFDRSDNRFWEGVAQAAPLTAGLWEAIPKPEPPPEPEVKLYSISGTVSVRTRLANVRVDLRGTRIMRTRTDASGHYKFTGLPAGIYVVTPTLAGYDFKPRDIVLTLP